MANGSIMSSKTLKYPQSPQRVQSVQQTTPIQCDSLTLHVHPESWLRSGKLHRISVSCGLSTSLSASTYLAPKHQPNSLPLIFFAIFTSRFKPMSYPVCKRPTIKFRSRQYSGRPFSSSNAPSTAPKLAHPF